MNTLDSLFTWFTTATLRASLLALAVFAIQFALRGRIPARWRYALWLPVVLVLAAPSLPQSRWSMENYVQPHVVMPAAPQPATESVTSDSLPVAAPAVPSPSPVDWRQVALLAWAGGVGACLLLGLGTYVLSLHRMRRGQVAVGTPLADSIQQAAAECGLRRTPRILVSTSVSSPAVTGMVRPLLLLPTEIQTDFTPAEVRLILLHELTHLRRHDLALNWLLCLMHALHWCNPVLWFAFARMRTDREAACDEQVLALTRGEERAGYGHVLLRLAAAPRPAGFALGLVGIFGPASALRERILGIARYRREHRAWRILGVALIAALAIAGATRAQPADAASAKSADVRQILIASKFFELSDRTAPLELNGASATIDKVSQSMALVQDPAEHANFLAALAKKKGMTVLAAPSVVTKDGQNAKIEIGQQIPPADPKDPKAATRFVGLSLDVTPQLVGGNIDLAVSCTRATLVDTQTGLPVVAAAVSDWTKVKVVTQEMKTNVTINEGEDLVLVQTSQKGQTNGTSPALVVALSPKIVNGANHPAAPEKAAPAPAGKGAEAKAATLKLRAIELRDATLAEAVDLLNAQAIAADPAKKGVPIFLAPNAGGEARISLSLSDIPLAEALKYITQLSNTHALYKGDQITITP